MRYGSALPPPQKAAKFYCLRPCCENPGPKSIRQSYGTASNSNDSHITREVNSQNVFSCCSHVICGSEIDQYNYPGINNYSGIHAANDYSNNLNFNYGKKFQPAGDFLQCFKNEFKKDHETDLNQSLLL